MSTKNFGLPYTGSKSRIAPWLMEMLPDCENFVDVFAGGCAVSHAMLLYGKAKTITMNDLQGDVVQLFLDALHGNLEKYNPYQWIDRTTFLSKRIQILLSDSFTPLEIMEKVIYIHVRSKNTNMLSTLLC